MSEENIATIDFSTTDNLDEVIGDFSEGLTVNGVLVRVTDSTNFVVKNDDETVYIETTAPDTFTINGEKISVDDSEATTLTITDGELKISDGNASDTEEILNKLKEDNPDYISISGKENRTLSGGEVLIVEDTSAKVNIKASKGQDTIYTAGKNVDIDLKAGGATEIFAAEGRATVENYNAKTSAAFLTENENIAEAIEENSIAFDYGRLTVNSAQVTFADDADSRLINFVNADDDAQKVGFVSNDSKLDASKETADLILIGESDSTILSGKGSDTIYGGEGNLINAGIGKNLIKLSGNGGTTLEMNGKDSVTGFKAALEDGDIIKTSTENLKLKFDGENILIGDDSANVYYGKKSGVDFSGYNESLTLDLSKNFYGINQVTVGGGLNTLIS